MYCGRALPRSRSTMVVNTIRLAMTSLMFLFPVPVLIMSFVRNIFTRVYGRPASSPSSYNGHYGIAGVTASPRAHGGCSSFETVLLQYCSRCLEADLSSTRRE